MTDVKEKMKPAVDVAEVNKTTVETLFSIQSEYVTDFINSGIAQMKALSEVKEPKDIMDLQVSYYKDLETKMTEVASKEVAALTDAKDKISEILEKSLSEIKDTDYVAEMTKYMNEASEAATKYMNEATASFTPEAAAPAAKPAAPKKAPAKTSRKPKAAAAE